MAEGSGDTAPLAVRLVGQLALFDGGRALPLPSSRKTRALFVYLLRARTPVRRERLCELFFDLPADPRAALRWSLTKIRAMLGARPDLLRTDGETVEIDPAGFITDVDRVGAMMSGSGEVDEGLLASIDPMVDEPLAGLDLPSLDSFSAWLAAERSLIDQVRSRLFLRAARSRSLTAEQRSRFALEAERLGAAAAPADGPPAGSDFDRTIRYCLAPDGPRIAYACTGEGPPLVKAANWLNHLELDWTSPIWGSVLNRLSRAHMLVRYDERGNGCSTWDVEDLSFEAFVRDLETVVDHLGLDRFPLLGISQGAAVSIDYACRHPGRVTRLILIGAYAVGWRPIADEETAAEREAMITLVRSGWGKNNPAYRQLFSQSFFPHAQPEELDWFNEFQRQTTSARNAARFLETFATIDVRHCLSELRTPTLVIHSRDDQRVPLDRAIEIASTVPGASLVTLESASHLPLAREPATERMLAAIESFLREG